MSGNSTALCCLFMVAINFPPYESPKAKMKTVAKDEKIKTWIKKTFIRQKKNVDGKDEKDISSKSSE